MRLSSVVVALSLMLAAPSAFAGRAKATKANAARKVDTAKKRTRAATVTTLRAGECDRVIFDDVPMRELRLVGIVGQGRLQKALLMDEADEAGTLMRGDCVGIERVPFDDVVKPLLAQHGR